MFIIKFTRVKAIFKKELKYDNSFSWCDCTKMDSSKSNGVAYPFQRTENCNFSYFRNQKGWAVRITASLKLQTKESLLFCYCFASYYDINPQPHLHSCYIINFNDHISSYFFQIIVYLIHFFQITAHLIHLL